MKKIPWTSRTDAYRKKSAAMINKSWDFETNKSSMLKTSTSTIKITEELRKRIKMKNYVPPEVCLDLTIEPEFISFDQRGGNVCQTQKALNEGACKSRSKSLKKKWVKNEPKHIKRKTLDKLNRTMLNPLIIHKPLSNLSNLIIFRKLQKQKN